MSEPAAYNDAAQPDGHVLIDQWTTGKAENRHIICLYQVVLQPTTSLTANHVGYVGELANSCTLCYKGLKDQLLLNSLSDHAMSNYMPVFLDGIMIGKM